MKKPRKILNLFVMTIMLFSMATAVFATQAVDVGSGSGSITVTNATEGKTYRLYNLFDATYSGDAVAYSYTKTSGSDAVFTLLTSTDSPFTLTQVRDTDTYVVTSEAAATEISAWIKNQLTETDGILSDGPVLKAIASANATESELKFDNLAYGYYFITSTLGTTITIDSNTPDEKVIDKNQGPSWDIDDEGSGKVITGDSNKTYDPATQENSVNAGDTVSFQIGVNTTNYNGDKAIVEYYINDSLDKGFVYDQDSLSVKIGSTALTKVENNPAVGSNYTVSWDTNANSFRITIPWYDEASGTFASVDANNTITVTYDATLEANDSTVYAGNGNKNKATYDFRDTSDTEPPGNDPYHVVEEKETTTYTFALGFSKIDGNTKEFLPGAEFRLKNAAGQFVTAIGSNGNYTYSGTTNSENQATTFSTDTNGALTVKGVAEGTYTIIETKAPNGYNQLTSPMTVTASISEASSYTTQYVTYYDENGQIVDQATENGSTVNTSYPVNAVNLMIENFKGSLLPETGGIGTTIFYVVGSLLVAGALILFAVRRRMKYGK